MTFASRRLVDRGPVGTTAELIADEALTTNGEVVTWDQADTNTGAVDDGSFWASGNPTRLTADKTGWYQISGAFNWTTTGVWSQWIEFNINGGTYKASPRQAVDNADFEPGMTMSFALYLDAADFVEMFVAQNSGSDKSIESGKSFFQMVRF